MDPTDNYAKKLLEDSVNGGKYQVQQAIARKDFAAARRLADVLAGLLPGRSDVAGLKEDIASAERAEEATHRAAAAAATVVRLRVFHMHSDRSPADKGPYCLGSLSVTDQRLKFAPESTSDGQLHNLEFACSEVLEIKKNGHVASRQGGFHIRTHAANFNFVPENPSSAPVPALLTACAK
jgi:hypothetical protein